MSSFSILIPFVLKNEGGFVNNPLDKGGATKYGITYDTLKSYYNHDITLDDIKNLTMDEAITIYQKLYWAPSHISLINDNRLALSVFDMGVLTGIDNTIKKLQEAYNLSNAVNHLKVDGDLGKLTATAVNNSDPLKLVRNFQYVMTHHFLDIVKKNPSQAIFIQGWLNRLNRSYLFK